MAPHLHPEEHCVETIGISNPATNQENKSLQKLEWISAPKKPCGCSPAMSIDQIHSICIFKDDLYSDLVCSILDLRGISGTGKTPGGVLVVEFYTLPSSSFLHLSSLMFPTFPPSHWQFLVNHGCALSGSQHGQVISKLSDGNSIRVVVIRTKVSSQAYYQPCLWV